MKLIHAGIMCNGRDEGLSYALRRAVDTYAEFPISPSIVSNIENAGFIPDILFMQIQSDNIDGVNTASMLHPLITNLKSKGCKVINWNGDIRKPAPHWMAQVGASINAFSNMRDVKQIVNGKFLQIGIDPVTFKRWDTPKNNDVVFMYNNYGNVYPLGVLRNDACSILLRHFNGKLYGGNHKGEGDLNADPKDPFPKQSAEAKVYSGCAIAISISQFDEPRYTSDRLLRCMGSGAFTLSHHYQGIEEDFTIGEHLDVFRTLPEMEDKIRFYLDNPEKRNEIADQGYKHIHENFTYRNMASNILKL